jgi:hypothetical protein
VQLAQPAARVKRVVISRYNQGRRVFLQRVKQFGERSQIAAKSYFQPALLLAQERNRQVRPCQLICNPQDNAVWFECLPQQGFHSAVNFLQTPLCRRQRDDDLFFVGFLANPPAPADPGSKGKTGLQGCPIPIAPQPPSLFCQEEINSWGVVFLTQGKAARVG